MRSERIPEAAPTSRSFFPGWQNGARIFIICCVGIIMDVRMSRSKERQTSTVSNGSFPGNRCSKSKIRLVSRISNAPHSRLLDLPFQNFCTRRRGLRQPVVGFGIEGLADVVDIEPALLVIHLQGFRRK